MNNIELARYYDDEQKKVVKITVSDYHELIAKKNKDEIANFIVNRLSSRYIEPYASSDPEYKKKYKNGFAIMASLCLLVETLQSFKNGWGDSDRKSEKAYKQFFKDNHNFPELVQKGSEIYKKVRCGILHQGETTGGWKITREGNELYNNDTNTLDAIIFSKRMKESLNSYRENLLNSEWDAEIWDNLRTKMRKVIHNCLS